MNLRSPSLRQALAAEYVLGNLGPAARRRFEREAAADPALQAEVQAWHRSLECLAPPAAVNPPPEVWTRISRELDRLERPARHDRRASRRALRFWQAATGLASAAALVLAVLLLVRQPSNSGESRAQRSLELPFAAHVRDAGYAAWLELPKETSVRWEISLNAQDRMLSVRSVGYPMLDADEDYELWWVGEGGGEMVSIGLLPRDGRWMRSLPRDLQLSDASRLVITREPAYGSPTDGPTGPVLVRTALRLRS